MGENCFVNVFVCLFSFRVRLKIAPVTWVFPDSYHAGSGCWYISLRVQGPDMTNKEYALGAVDVFNPLRVFTKEPITKQEIKWACMNLQLFISPLLKYEGWLYNIINDKNFEISSLEPPCTGGLKIPHTPMGTCRNAKNENFELCFDCGKNVFQWTQKNHLGHFDWNCLGSRYPIRPNT